MRLHHKTLSQRGMTLLEVMVALAIFALAATSLMYALNQHVTTLSQLNSRFYASMVAENQRSLLILSHYSSLSSSGREEMANRQWFWKVSPLATSSDLLRAYEIRVSDSESGDAIVTVRGYAPN